MKRINQAKIQNVFEYFVQIGEPIAKKAKLVNETNFKTLNNSISQGNSSTYLVLMFQPRFWTGNIPFIFKIAKVLPTFKSGNKQIIKIYRSL